MPQYTRLRHQFDFSDTRDLMLRQYIAHPGGTAPRAFVAAMINVLQRRHASAIARKQQRGFQIGFGIDQHIIHRIAKRIFHTALAPVIGDARNVIDAIGHSAAKDTFASPLIARTTSTALESPSSWKPFFIHAPQNHVLFVPLNPRTCSWAPRASIS